VTTAKRHNFFSGLQFYQHSFQLNQFMNLLRIFSMQAFLGGIFLLTSHAFALSGATSSPSAKTEDQVQAYEEPIQKQVTPAQTNLKQALTHVLKEKGQEEGLSKAEQKLLSKLDTDSKIGKKLEKIDIKSPSGYISFEDVVTLAGAVVTVIGIISIIFDPISGIVVALLGLLVYFLGRQAGGSLNNFFD
jgi:hypothetical protein